MTRKAHDAVDFTHRPHRTAVRVLRALLLPVVVAAVVTAASPGWGSYVVRRGDTLSDIAHRYHTTVAALTAANDLPGNNAVIYAGATLQVPTTTAARRAAQGASRSRTSVGAGKAVRRTSITYRRHRVVAGDSVARLARRYHTTEALIAKANRLGGAHGRSRVIVLGTTLSIPIRVTSVVRAGAPHAKSRSTSRARSSKSPNTFAGRTYSDAVANAAAHNRAVLNARRQPSKRAVKDLIVSTAKHYGLDPSIALAVGWQESGWNQARVSPANAIGIMQVIPSTGAWASTIVGRRLDLLNPRDNVIAGVVLLRVLTRQAKLPDAIGGYYQGLASVRRHGHFADTKVYVSNVLSLRQNYS